MSHQPRVAESGGLAELRAAFEELRATLDRFGAPTFPRGQGVLLTDLDGAIAYIGPGFEELFGISSDSYTGGPVARLLAATGLPGAEWPTIEGHVTATLRLPDGSQRVVRQHALPLTDPAGQPAGTLHIFQDMTATIERTRELQEKSRELDDARDRLTRSQHLKALGELSAEVAHEFGNLLQAIGLQAAAMRRQGLPEAAAPALRSIKQAVDIGRALTRRLLTFARDEEHGRVETVDVGQVLRDIVQLLEPRINKHPEPVLVELSIPGLPSIEGSSTKLTEAFLNLFLNALEAMPHGGTLQVSAVERSGEIRVAVHDTGKGMTAEEQRRAFDPFFTTKASGTGLGLSTVYGTVCGHRGSIFLESEPGKGTTVFVSLPTVAPPAAIRPGTQMHPTRLRCPVLVVDDHPTVRQATAELLATWGYRVESAGTAADALAAMERERFTAVVTDMGLPDRPGWDVARAAKRHSAGTVVVMVSGWGSHFSGEEARARGVDLVFEKPVDPDLLLSALEHAVG
jgi:signal transduction histidine kinase